MGTLQERITTTKTGSVTSIQAVYVPADDLTDPSPATTFAHLDSTVTLSRAITDLGIYPAVDPLDSTSQQLDPLIVGEEHYNVAQEVMQVLQRLNELKDTNQINNLKNIPLIMSFSKKETQQFRSIKAVSGSFNEIKRPRYGQTLKSVIKSISKMEILNR